MSCWPDLWDKFRDFLPLLSELAVFSGYVALLVVLLWAPKVRRRPLRIASRSLGVAGVVPLVFLVPAALLGRAFSLGNPPTESRVTKSPTSPGLAAAQGIGGRG